MCLEIRLGRAILWYSIEPHALGVRWWDPSRPLDRQAAVWFERKS